MKIYFNSLSFGETIKTYSIGSNVVKEYYDGNKITSREENDVWGRLVDVKRFDNDGNVVEVLHKDYFKTENKEGFIEFFKNKTQEYIRKAYIKIENGLKHSIDDFSSKSGKIYFNDFIYDMSGKLLRVISNGKVIELK